MFHKITLEDKTEFDALTKNATLNACDYPFAVNYIWADYLQAEVAFVNNTVCIRYFVDGKRCYLYPMGGDAASRTEIVKKLLEEEAGEETEFTLISEDNKEELKRYFKGRFEITEDRDHFDYVYNREKLEKLPGKHLSSKRNFLHRFNDGGDWTFEELSKTGFEECLGLDVKWNEKHGYEMTGMVAAEAGAIRRAFEHYDELGLFGAVIRQEGRIVAFSVAEKLNDNTAVIHFEKADIEAKGSYQIINQQFAEHFKEFEFLNREDDAGNEGLRKSKLSYLPDVYVKKYTAVNSGFSYADKEDYPEIIKLWKGSFGDTDEFITSFLNDMCDDEKILMLKRDGKPVSMAVLLDGAYANGEENMPVKYLYALNTAKEERNKGYATLLLKHIKEKIKKPVFLAPANDALAAYYEKFGFKTFCEREEITETCSETQNDAVSAGCTEYWEFSEGLVNRYLNCRNKAFAGHRALLWDESFIRFALMDLYREKGKVIETDGIMAAVKDGDSLIVEECTALGEERAGFLKKLAAAYGKKVCFVLPKSQAVGLKDAEDNIDINYAGLLLG
ncbi:MAG: GNAT family N-acetyltransferase [Lachnospiraceae bacterium]|nr:GNAT family N-acetyltransferase [Lachnospiraceae bacterium]